MVIRRHAVVPLGVAVLLDRAVTMQAFHYESNPLVTALGPFSWILLSLVLVALGSWLWYQLELWQSRVALGCVGLCTGLTLLAVVSNAIVLL